LPCLEIRAGVIEKKIEAEGLKQYRSYFYDDTNPIPLHLSVTSPPLFLRGITKISQLYYFLFKPK
jgi:hypothetical protein